MKFLWVKLACRPAPKFVIFFDDDTVIDLTGILKKLNEKSTKVPTIIGHGTILAKFERNPCSKWFVPENLFPEKFVPFGLNYALGYFVISLNGAHEVLLNSVAKSQRNLVWHEDVTFYGILRNESGIQLENWIRFAYPIGYQKERMKMLEKMKNRGIQLIFDLVNRTKSDQFLFSHLGRGDFYHLVWNSFQTRNSLKGIK